MPIFAKMHVYEVRPRMDHRGVNLISDALPFDRLWYGEPNAVANAIGYAMHRSQSHDGVVRVYDNAGNVIETHEHKGEFKEWQGPGPRRVDSAVTFGSLTAPAHAGDCRLRFLIPA